MNEQAYIDRVKIELEQWEKEIVCEPSFLDKLSRRVQKKVDSFIPDIVHEKIAQALQLSIKGLTSGIALITSDDYLLQKNLPLRIKDSRANELILKYKNLASAEGAVTGAGGALLSAVDFPALIGIKLKLLQELSTNYGFNAKEFSERMFMIKLFQFAYSIEYLKFQRYEELRDWQPSRTEEKTNSLFTDGTDWRAFATEYRDAIDMRKLLQIVPGIGAVVGAIANRSILDDLAQAAIRIYQLRVIKELDSSLTN
jgi:hypothetical protein